MKLRYVFVFALGMACMYRLARSGLVMVNPIHTSTTGQMSSGSQLVTGSLDTDSGTTNLATGDAVSGAIDSGNAIVDETVDLMNGSGFTTGGISDVVDVPAGNSYTKTQACTQPTGSYDIPVQVGWNETLTARTKGFIKLSNFLHYVVEVSDGSKYYFYHNCSNGVATNARDLTATALTSVYLSNGQVYLR